MHTFRDFIITIFIFTILKKAIEINPTLPDAHSNLGFAYWNKGLENEDEELKKKAMREVTIYKGLMGAQ